MRSGIRACAAYCLRTNKIVSFAGVFSLYDNFLVVSIRLIFSKSVAFLYFWARLSHDFNLFEERRERSLKEMVGGGGIPPPLRKVVSGVSIILGGMFSLSLASSAVIKTLQNVSEAKPKKVAMPCGVCRGKGFYPCKLCRGNATIEWSPLYDPVVINPCLCPTCEGNRVQRCLNCLGKGYV